MSERSIGASSPKSASLPTQSLCPTNRSGPCPWGAIVVMSSRILVRSVPTVWTFTSTPVAFWWAAALAVSAAACAGSDQMRIEDVALGAPLALALAEESVPSPAVPQAPSSSPAAANAANILILPMMSPLSPARRPFRGPVGIMPRWVADGQTAACVLYPCAASPAWRNWQRTCLVNRGFPVRVRASALYRVQVRGGFPALGAVVPGFWSRIGHMCPAEPLRNPLCCSGSCLAIGFG